MKTDYPMKEDNLFVFMINVLTQWETGKHLYGGVDNSGGGVRIFMNNGSYYWSKSFREVGMFGVDGECYCIHF